MPANYTTEPLEKAAGYLADAYAELLSSGAAATLEAFEDEAPAIAHSLAARAYGAALERHDAELRASLPRGARAHDRRRRTLATRLGDVTFSHTRCLDRLGLPFSPLLDAPGVPHGARVSPSASAALVELAADVSYAKAGRAPGRMGGSRVSAAGVMRLVRAAEDAGAARDLFADGVLPGGSEGCAELLVEADGTWFSLQGRDRLEAPRCEVKALVAYAGKSARGSKVGRAGCARHACVAAPAQFMREAVAAVASRYDLSALREVHVGCDGEAWCRSAGSYFPCRSSAHLDPFHVNRALMSCFDGPRMGRRLVDAALLELAASEGLARPKRAGQVAAYLRGNAGLVGAEGPSLGTTGSENRHVYGARTGSFPCAWSRRGAPDMAGIRSRLHSGRALPRPTREGSATAARRRRRAELELAALSRPRRGLLGGKVRGEGLGAAPREHRRVRRGGSLLGRPGRGPGRLRDIESPGFPHQLYAVRVD